MLSLGQRALWRLQALYAIWRIIFSNLVIAVQRIVSECKFASSARQRVSVVICVPLTMITGSGRIVSMRSIHVFYLTIGVIMAAAFLGHKLGHVHGHFGVLAIHVWLHSSRVPHTHVQ